MFKPTLAPFLATTLITSFNVLAEETIYMGQPQPGTKVTRFAPGLVSTDESEHGRIVFSPDTSEALWVRRNKSNGNRFEIMTSRRQGKSWTPARVADFSFQGFNNGGPFYSRDGAFILFHSDHPIEPGTPRKFPAIWSATRIDADIKKPVTLANEVNREFASDPWVMGKRTLVYTSNRMGSRGAFDLFSFALNQAGGYSQNLDSNVNSPAVEARATYSAKQDAIIFWSIGRKDSLGSGDLYISFKEDNNTWSQAINMGPDINSAANDSFPSISPDGQYLFFMSKRTGNDDIYWISINPTIDDLRSKHK